MGIDPQHWQYLVDMLHFTIVSQANKMSIDTTKKSWLKILVDLFSDLEEKMETSHCHFQASRCVYDKKNTNINILLLYDNNIIQLMSLINSY